MATLRCARIRWRRIEHLCKLASRLRARELVFIVLTALLSAAHHRHPRRRSRPHDVFRECPAKCPADQPKRGRADGVRSPLGRQTCHRPTQERQAEEEKATLESLDGDLIGEIMQCFGLPRSSVASALMRTSKALLTLCALASSHSSAASSKLLHSF